MNALAPGVGPAAGHLACARYVLEERVGVGTAPVLVLAATADPVSYPHTGKVAAARPHAKPVDVAEIEGGRIPLMEQKTTEVVSAIEAFFASAGI